MKTLILGAVLLIIAVLLMGVRVFFTKNGKFPNTHVGANKAMKERGIPCATTQDRQARAKESPIEKILKSENL